MKYKAIFKGKIRSMQICKRKKHTDIQISCALYAYIVYILFLSISDILSLPLFYAEANQLLPAVIATAGVIAIILAWQMASYCAFDKLSKNKSLLIYMVVILLIAVLRSLAPDLAYDTSQGRVYWQDPGFVDNVDENVFPAGFTFFFPLSDRIFYYPRVLLGYRMGTLMNALVMILIFLQMYKLIHMLLGKQMESLRKDYTEKAINRPIYGILTYLMSEELFAFISVTLFYALADLGSYMIDLLAIPLLLWLLHRVLDESQQSNRVEQIFVALLCGLSFAMKFTNVIFIAPVLLVYLWQNRKEIRATTFALALIVGLLPAAPYLLYAYTSTGNPVYWTFNSIFKSPYYPDENFKDLRWGPQNWVQVLLWPLHIILHPTERVSELSIWPQIYLMVGYLGGIYVIIKTWKEHYTRKATLFAALFFAFVLLWLKSTGFPRYAILCEMMAVVLGAYLIVGGLAAKVKWKKLVAMILMVALLGQCAINTVGGALNYYDWSFRWKISPDTLSSEYKLNAQEAFRDRGLIGTDEQREQIDIFLSTHLRHSIMKALDPDAPIVNGNYIVTFLSAVKEAKGIDYAEYYFTKLAEEEKKGARIYDIAIANEYSEFISGANSVGAEIISLEEVDGYFIGRDTPILIEYSMTGRENTCTDLAQQPAFEFPQGTGEISLTGIACLPSYVQWDYPPAILQVTVSTASGTNEVLTVEIPQHEYIQLDEVLDLSPYSKDGPVTVMLSDIGAEAIDGNIFNLKVVAK